MRAAFDTAFPAQRTPAAGLNQISDLSSEIYSFSNLAKLWSVFSKERVWLTR